MIEEEISAGDEDSGFSDAEDTDSNVSISFIKFI